MKPFLLVLEQDIESIALHKVVRMKGKNPVEKGSSSVGTVSAAVSSASVVASLAGPIGWLALAAPLAAVAAGGMIERIRAAGSDNGETSEGVGALAEEASDHILDAIRKSPGLEKISLAEAMDSEMHIFPPGHPLPGRVYRLHPLARPHADTRGDVYIPIESHDEILYAEREAELLRLLVKLGATRIVIRKQTSSDGALSAAAEAGSEKQFGLSASAEVSKHGDSSDQREFILEGSEWSHGDSIEVSEFPWLSYEAAWKSIVNAREVGKCTKASIELKTASSFSLGASLGLSLDFLPTSFNFGLEGKHSRSGADSHFVEVEFRAS